MGAMGGFRSLYEYVRFMGRQLLYLKKPLKPSCIFYTRAEIVHSSYRFSFQDRIFGCFAPSDSNNLQLRINLIAKLVCLP